MEKIQADVVIVGAGGAGLRASIAVAEANPDLKVADLQGLPDAQQYLCCGGWSRRGQDAG